MATREPDGELDPRFSDPSATPTRWAEARDKLDAAKAYWLTTVRTDGRPHVTTIAGVWLDDAIHFTTGQNEQKAKNLEHNSKVAVTTGSEAFEGLDVVVEGEAIRVTDEDRLRRLAEAYLPKYDRMFVFEVRDGGFHIDRGEDEVLAFEIRPTKAFGFRKGETFGQTRWRF
jgi:uncharacterized pyridoxamine 5'-phosphate oxidase family protein